MLIFPAKSTVDKDKCRTRYFKFQDVLVCFDQHTPRGLKFQPMRLAKQSLSLQEANPLIWKLSGWILNNLVHICSVGGIYIVPYKNTSGLKIKGGLVCVFLCVCVYAGLGLLPCFQTGIMPERFSSTERCQADRMSVSSQAWIHGTLWSERLANSRRKNGSILRWITEKHLCLKDWWNVACNMIYLLIEH